MYALSNQTFSRTKAGDHPQSLERKHSRVTNAGATSNGTGDVTIMDSRLSSREDKREKNAITHPRKKNSSSRQKDNAFDERKSKISGVDEPKPSIMQAAAKSPVAKDVARRNDHQFDTVHDSTKQLSPTYTSMATLRLVALESRLGRPRRLKRDMKPPKCTTNELLCCRSRATGCARRKGRLAYLPITSNQEYREIQCRNIHWYHCRWCGCSPRTHGRDTSIRFFRFSKIPSMQSSDTYADDIARCTN